MITTSVDAGMITIMRLHAYDGSCALVPGPTRMLANVLEAQAVDLPSPDLEESFWDDYMQLEVHLQQFLDTEIQVAIQSGEGMLALWGALKSTLQLGDKVLCVGNGIFGEGFGQMARALGADVHMVQGDWKRAVDTQQVIDAIKRHNPKLVTMVHCETPTGLLNPLEGIGEAIERHTSDGLLLVDFVSSAVGAPLNVDALKIDIGLLGPQKALSGPTALAFTSVSDKAWRRIGHVDYKGYDALRPFHQASALTNGPRLLPYTHNWHAIRATLAACDNVLNTGGIQASIERHAAVAAFCRAEIKKMGLDLYCDERVASPTVTAINVPEGCEWPRLNAALRAQNVYVGGSYGPLAGKVFRIGHMGSQADKALVGRGLRILSQVLKKLK